MGRRATLAAVALTAALALATGAAFGQGTGGGAEPRASLPDIEDEVMCPICGTALNLSESPQAERERAFIRRLIAEGRTKDEIKQALVGEYGEDVLATPEASGFDLTAWLVPGVGILLAALGVVLGVRRWRRGAATDDADEPGPPPRGEDAGRLESDLARYDL